jgi:hypothetical protein
VGRHLTAYLKDRETIEVMANTVKSLANLQITTYLEGFLLQPFHAILDCCKGTIRGNKIPAKISDFTVTFKSLFKGALHQ